MNIFKRLRNLWRLSEIPVEIHRERTVTHNFLSSIFSQQAKVVDMHDPLSVDLGDEKENEVHTI